MKVVDEYYAGYDEDSRLLKDNSHKIEFITTVHFLDRNINAKSKVLDVGAGTGIYSFYYAEKGHQVTSLDIVTKNVDIMKEKSRLTSVKYNIDIEQGDARDLSKYEDESFDVVLCLGPLYHLAKYNDRVRCIKECLRVLKKDGLLAIAYINRYATYAVHIGRDKNNINDIGMKNIYIDGLEYGNEKDCFYYSTYHEIENIMKNYNIEKVNHVGSDGIVNMMRGSINSLTDEEFGKWVEYHLMTCEDSSLIGYSLHGLYICRKDNEKYDV